MQVRSSSCSISTILFLRRIIRRVSNRPASEVVERLLKLKPENLDDEDVVADRGDVDDVEDVEEADRAGDSGVNAVLRRRRP